MAFSSQTSIVAYGCKSCGETLFFEKYIVSRANQFVHVPMEKVENCYLWYTEDFTWILCKDEHLNEEKNVINGRVQFADHFTRPNINDLGRFNVDSLQRITYTKT